MRFEPTALTEAVRALMVAVVLMGWWPLTDAQQTAWIVAVSAILAAVNRALVTPNSKL